MVRQKASMNEPKHYKPNYKEASKPIVSEMPQSNFISQRLRDNYHPAYGFAQHRQHPNFYGEPINLAV